MGNPVSTTRTDYGAAAFDTTTTDDDDSAAVGDSSDCGGSGPRLFPKRFATHSDPQGYQSLPCMPNDRRSGRSRFAHTSASFVMLPSRHGKMSLDTLPNSETRQIAQRMEFTLNVLNQICIGFVTIYMSWLCLRMGLAGTALHAWLVTIGFSFLMAEGIMCHHSGNVLTFNYKRTTKTTIHWVLQALGGSVGIAGVLIKLIQKDFSLHSTHSKLGFAAFIICLFSMLSGLSALCSMRIKQLLSPLLNKSVHNLLGIVTFVLALLAQYYGYQTGFFSRKVDYDFQVLIKCITLISLVLSSIGPLQALYHKIRNIMKHFR